MFRPARLLRISTFSQRKTAVVALFMLILCTGCTDTISSVPEPVPDQAVLPQQAHTTTGLDNLYAEIARLHPGFGGAALENGRWTIYAAPIPDLTATDKQRVANYVSALEARFRLRDDVARMFGKHQPAVRYVRYSYDQLAGWRARAREMLFPSGDLHFLDIREQENRIVAGLSAEASAERIWDLLHSSGIPRRAVHFVSAAPSVPTTSLRDAHEVPRGGHQIEFGDASVCTLALAGRFGASRAYVTSSHCTLETGEATGTVHTQGGVQIGHEIYDPAYASHLSGCPDSFSCRYSDVAIGVFDADRLWHPGQLAHPVARNPNGASVELLPHQPALPIRGEVAYPVGGETLSKIGRTTGWTFGPVTGTCQDIRVGGTNVVLLCQDRVTAGVDGGDSGAAVFAHHGDEAVLYGVLWGRMGDDFLFSSLYNIREDIRRTADGQRLQTYGFLAADPGPVPDDVYTKSTAQ